MLQFILRRLGLIIPTFIGITLLTFAFVHMIPGDPVMIMAGERGISPERHAQLLAELGLDKPMWQQYLHYIWGVMHGDLGISMKSRIPVWEEFVPRFQATLELGVCAMIFATAVGIPVGVLAAVKRGSIFDHTAVGLALTGYSMPIFWWGMMLIMQFSQQLRVTLRGDPTFARHDHHRIARDHVDKGKCEKGNTDKRGDDESQTSENKLQHNPDSL